MFSNFVEENSQSYHDILCQAKEYFKNHIRKIWLSRCGFFLKTNQNLRKSKQSLENHLINVRLIGVSRNFALWSRLLNRLRIIFKLERSSFSSKNPISIANFSRGHYNFWYFKGLLRWRRLFELMCRIYLK